MTLEPRHAEILLEFLNLPAERGLRDVQLLGGLADRAAAGHRREVTQADAGYFPNSPPLYSDAEWESCRSQNCSCAIRARSAQFARGISKGGSHARHGRRSRRPA